MKIAHIGRVRARSETRDRRGDQPVLRVLVADSRDEFRRFARLMLGSTPYRIDEASSGEELARKLRLERYAVVLMDLRFPDVTPREALESVRRLGGTARVILWTALPEERVQAFTDEPMGEQLRKDCGRIHLIAAVCHAAEAQRRHLGRARTAPPEPPLLSSVPPPAA